MWNLFPIKSDFADIDKQFGKKKRRLKVSERFLCDFINRYSENNDIQVMSTEQVIGNLTFMTHFCMNQQLSNPEPVHLHLAAQNFYVPEYQCLTSESKLYECFFPIFSILNFSSIFYGSPIVWSGIWPLQDTLVSVSHFLAAKHEHVTWFMSLSNVLDGAFCLNKHFICIITLKCHIWNKLWDMAGMW